MTARTLTAAQERALAWLPAGGEWRRGDSALGLALVSLWQYRGDLVEVRFNRWRLTPAGIALRAARGEQP